MIGERVRLAREACRLTQTELATLSGVAQNTISDLELGVIFNPSDDTLARIASATQFPLPFFSLGPLPDLPDGHFRKLKRGTSKVGRQVRANVRQVVEVVQRSVDFVELPRVRPRPVLEVSSMEDVEEIAARFRVDIGVGERDPIPNLTRAVERAGVVVIELSVEMEDHDGFSAWPAFGDPDLARPVVAYGAGRSGDRIRFTIGHELGHLLLHTLRPTVAADQAEKEANRFAGALLLPAVAAEEVLRTPVTLTTLMGVKATYGVSIAMAAQRAVDLGVITQPQFVSLRKQMSARKWIKSEPIEVVAETPMLLAKLLGILGGQGTTSERANRAVVPVFSFSAWSKMPERSAHSA